jgi:hypothetical protein
VETKKGRLRLTVTFVTEYDIEVPSEVYGEAETLEAAAEVDAEVARTDPLALIDGVDPEVNVEIIPSPSTHA